MAYKPRYRKRKYKDYQKTWYNKKYTIKTSPYEVAMKALSGVKYLKGLVNSEKHHHSHTGFVNGNVSTAGDVRSLVAIEQGDTIGTRNGNSIMVKSIYLKLRINWNISNSGVILKYWIIKDTQQTADSAPTFANIFNGRDVLSMLNSESLGRYSILKSGQFSQDDQKKTIQTQIYHAFKPYGQHVRYNGTTTTDIQKNGLYLVLCSSVGANLPTVLADLRTSYMDN